MDPDGDKQITIFKRQKDENIFLQGSCSGVSPVLQSLRVRRSSIFFNNTYRKHMESQFRIILYCGSFFWVLYLTYTLFK